MRDIYLHGALGKQFGRHLRLDVRDVPEVIRALCANFPAFANSIRKGFYRVVVGDKLRSGLELGVDQLEGFNLGERALHLLPVPKGRKNGGIGKIIAGIALIGLSLVPGMAPIMGATLWGSTTVGSVVGSVASSLILTGVASLIAPEQESGDSNKSFTMSGPTTSMREGGILPIAYGDVVVGGAMISGGVQIDQSADTTASNANQGTTSAPLINTPSANSGSLTSNSVPGGSGYVLPDDRH